MTKRTHHAQWGGNDQLAFPYLTKGKEVFLAYRFAAADPSC
jgi:hypothetical protein